MTLKILTVSLLICLVRFSGSKEFPKNVSRCRPSDNECVVKTANNIIQNYQHGFPELNLVNLEPFPIGDIKIKGDSSKSVNLDLEMTDLTLVGYSNINFTKFGGFKDEPQDMVIDSESVCKHVEIKGKYKISGKLLIFPITGEGDISCKVDGLHIKSRYKLKIETRDGKKYLKTDYNKIKAKADHMTVKVANLFNGDKVLGDNMNKILNENWEVLWEEMEPPFNEQLAKVNGEAIDKILGSFEYKDLFLLDE